MAIDIPQILAGVEWHESGAQPSSELPYTTHHGVLELMGHTMRCYRLNTGEAVFDADDFEAFMEKFLLG